MIKSQFSDAALQDHGFTKHIHHVLVDMGVFPNTKSRLIELYQIAMVENLQSTGSGGGKPRNTVLLRKVLGPGEDPTGNVWHMLRMWREGVEYDDASSSGSVAVDTLTGEVHVVMVFGKQVNGALRFQQWEETIERATFGPAIERLPVLGSGVDHTAALEALQRASEAQAQTIAGIELALGNISQEPGTLDPKDRDILDRYRKLHGLD